jgi:hypothetical protein
MIMALEVHRDRIYRESGAFDAAPLDRRGFWQNKAKKVRHFKAALHGAILISVALAHLLAGSSAPAAKLMVQQLGIRLCRLPVLLHFTA